MLMQNKTEEKNRNYDARDDRMRKKLHWTKSPSYNSNNKLVSNREDNTKETVYRAHGY